MIRRRSVPGILLACCLLFTGAEAETVRDPDIWTAVLLPDGTLMYVRYGPPGGVRIESASGLPDSMRMDESGLSREEDGPARATTAVETAPGIDPTQENLARVRRVLREELARLPPGATVPQGWLNVAHGDRPPGDGRTVIVDRVPPPAPPRVTVVTPPPAEPESGESPTVPPVGDAVLPAPPEPIVETRIIREQFLSGGLFRTNLVLFETDRADLLPFSRDLLRTIGGVLNEFPEARIRVEGHTDHRGSNEHNLDLSRRRAESVRGFLIENTGISPDRIEARGYGEDRPIASGNSQTELALNRRVEFRILNPEVLRRTTGE